MDFIELNSIKIVASSKIPIMDENSELEDQSVTKKLKELEFIIDQKIISNEDAKRFENIMHNFDMNTIKETKFPPPWISWAERVIDKAPPVQYNIAMMLLNYQSNMPPLHKMAFLMKYFPNDDTTVSQIKTILMDIDDSKELKSFKESGMYSLLDLSCTAFHTGSLYGSLSKPKVVEELLKKGMDLQDMHIFYEVQSPECLGLLLFDNGKIRLHVEKIINQKDPFTGCTALHKAAQRRCNNSVQYLLEAGANFGTTNDLGESCVSQIDPMILENFLNDQCISTNHKSINDKNLELTFNYRCMRDN